MKLKLLITIILLYSNIGNAILPFQLRPHNIILLGSIQLNQPLDGWEIPISYKGQPYKAEVDADGDTRKAHFELHDEEMPKELFIMITEGLAQPIDINITHLQTSPNHQYRLFRLTKTAPSDATQVNAKRNQMSSWQIEELDNKKKYLIIPDNTIIFFMDCTIVAELENISWPTTSNIIPLPSLNIKKEIPREKLTDLAIQMELAFCDFKFLHKKPLNNSIAYTNDRIISMPYLSKKIRI
ncbi:MAG: hypothetical protein WDZ41_03200 [Candidatus Babeliales bacterium]